MSTMSTTTTTMAPPPLAEFEREATITRTVRGQRFSELESARNAAGVEYNRRRAPTESLTRIIPQEEHKTAVRRLSVDNVLSFGDRGISHIKTDPIVSSRLDENTKAFLDDFQELLRDVQYLLRERNISPHMQQLWRDALELRREAPLIRERTRQARFRARKTAEYLRERPPEVEEGRVLIQNLRSLVFQMIMSKEFRTVSFDALSAIREMMRPQMGMIDPTERTAHREHLIERLKEALHMIGANESYRQAVVSIFNLYDRLKSGGTLNTATSQLRYNAEYLTYNRRLQKLLTDSVALVEEFTGPGSVEYIKREAMSVIDAARHDPDLNYLLQDMRSWVIGILDNPSRIDEEGFNARTTSLWDRAIMLSRSYPQIGNIFDATSDMVKRVRDDALLNKLVEDNRRVVTGIIAEQDGELRLKLDVIYQLRSLIVPMVIETVREVSLPRIEGVAATPIGKIEYAIDNLLLGGVNVMPQNVHLAIRNALQVDMEQITHPLADVSSRVIINVNKITARFTDILFSFKHLSLPFIKDTGSADVVINETGNGIWIKVSVDILSPSHYPMIRVHKIRVWVSNINITVGDSRMSGVYNMIFASFKKIIQRQVEKRIALQLQSTIHALDSSLRGVLDKIPASQITQNIVNRVLSPAPGKLGVVAAKAREMMPSASSKRAAPWEGRGDKHHYYTQPAEWHGRELGREREHQWRQSEREYIYYPPHSRDYHEKEHYRPAEWNHQERDHQEWDRDRQHQPVMLGQLASKLDDLHKTTPHERHPHFAEKEPETAGRSLGDISGSESFFEQRGRPFGPEAAAPMTLDQKPFQATQTKRRESRELVLRDSIPRIIEEYPSKHDLSSSALDNKRQLNEDLKRISGSLLVHRGMGPVSKGDLDHATLDAKRKVNAQLLQIRDTLLWATRLPTPSTIHQESQRLSKIA